MAAHLSEASHGALLLLRFCCLRFCASIRAEALGNSQDAWARKVRLNSAERRDEGATKASESGSAPHTAPRHCSMLQSLSMQQIALELAEPLESNVIACRCEVSRPILQHPLTEMPPPQKFKVSYFKAYFYRRDQTCQLRTTALVSEPHGT